MRTTNRRPEDRASNQATNAVRRFPRWRVEVGDGANRPAAADGCGEEWVAAKSVTSGRVGKNCCDGMGMPAHVGRL